MTIVHLARRSDWDAGQRSGEYRTSTRGVTVDDVGFIHASFPHQLAAVAEFAYADTDEELCVLVMDEDTIRAAGTPVMIEDGGCGERYPHIYGPIDPAWVTDVLPARFGEDGRFRF